MKDLRAEVEELTINLDGIYSKLEQLADAETPITPPQIQSDINNMEMLALRGWDFMDLSGHGDLYGETIRTLNSYYEELLFRTTIERFGNAINMKNVADSSIRQVVDNIKRKNTRTTRFQHPDLALIVTQFPEPYDSLAAVLFNHAELVLKIKYSQGRDEISDVLGLSAPRLQNPPSQSL